MKAVGLDGRSYRLSGGRIDEKKSSYHLEARKLLSRLFPSERILEEVHVPGCGPSLYLDFLLPQHKLAVEVQGEQHYKYSPFFHGNKQAFLDSQRRDQLKKDFCLLNEIILVEFPYDAGDWAQRVIEAFRAAGAAE